MRTQRKAAPMNGAGLVRVVVVDDQQFMRELISASLSNLRDVYKVIGEAANAASAVTACEKLKPDLLILDVNLPGGNGIEAVPRLKAVSPCTRILLCTAYPSAESADRARKSGAHGFVQKTSSWDNFMEAVERVSRGEHYFVSRDATDAGSAENGGRAVESLTPREREILKLISQSDSSKEIASTLGISVATVERHRTNLMAKIGARNVAGMVSFAFDNGIVEVKLRRR